jgi:hypothetical protein
MEPHKHFELVSLERLEVNNGYRLGAEIVTLIKINGLRKTSGPPRGQICVTCNPIPPIFSTDSRHARSRIRAQFSETEPRLMNRLGSPLQHQPGSIRTASFADEGRFGEKRRRQVRVHTKRPREPVHSAARRAIDPDAKKHG